MKSLAAFSKATPEVRECRPLSEPIDAVYTWVNGSDVDFLASLAKYKPNDENGYKYKGADPALHKTADGVSLGHKYHERPRSSRRAGATCQQYWPSLLVDIRQGKIGD